MDFTPGPVKVRVELTPAELHVHQIARAAYLFRRQGDISEDGSEGEGIYESEGSDTTMSVELGSKRSHKEGMYTLASYPLFLLTI